MARRKGFLWFIGGTLKGIDIIRRVVIDVIFIAIVVVILVAVLRPKAPPIPATAALYLKPRGMLVEQVPDRLRRAQQRLLGRQPAPVVRVRDLVNALDAARTDPRIRAVVLNLNDFVGGELPQLARVSRALKQFESSGKPVIAYAANYGQGAYYLAAVANTTYLTTQQGLVAVLGLSAYRNYYKDLLDKLKVQWHVFRVGKYKSFVEPFTRNGMSPAAKQENTVLLNSLWKNYLGQVARARHLRPADLAGFVNHLPAALAAANGNAAAAARRAGLINGVLTVPEIRAKLAKLVGANPAGRNGYNRIGLGAYLAARHPAARLANRGWDQVAVIVAQGDIVPGAASQGTVGSRTLTRLIDRAARDERVKAVVLDVDSPGGSALAADEILHAELNLKRAGKPLVVSMSGLAASGGYWISMAANRIYASAGTITGSIGIFAMFPTFQRTLTWAGIHRDGVETSPLADFGDPLRAVSPDAAKVFQLIIKHGYAEFTGKVAKYRNLPLSHVDTIAQGRVWPGVAAKRIGLVDEIGGLDAAVRAAAKLAKLRRYGVAYLASRLKPYDKFLVGMSRNTTARVFVGHLFGGSDIGPISLVAGPALAGIKRILALRDPNGIYAYCFCDAIAEVK